MYSISYKNGITLIRENCDSHAFGYVHNISLHQVKFQTTYSNGYATGWINSYGKFKKMPSYNNPPPIFVRKTTLPTTTGYPLIFKNKKFLIRINDQWCEVIGGSHLIINDRSVLLYTPIFK